VKGEVMLWLLLLSWLAIGLIGALFGER